jgi:hypothetical protein
MTDKMMSTLKRGTLTCAVFFILAIVAGIGPNAAKASKAFGALVIVAILIQSDMSTVLTDIDGIIKNDWIGTTPTNNANGDSGDSGTGTKGTAGSDALGILEKGVGALQNDLSPYGELQKVLGAIGIHF